MMKIERFFCFILKTAEFLVTIGLIFSIGFPYWMIIVAAIFVPIYGIYLMIRSPEQLKIDSPNLQYKNISIAKSWKMVDFALCSTMATICFIFAFILFLFYLKLENLPSNVVISAVFAFFLSIFYALNGFLIIRQIQTGIVDFPTNQNKNLFSTTASKSSPLPNKLADKSINVGQFGQKISQENLNIQKKYSPPKFEKDSLKRKIAVPSSKSPKIDETEIKQIPKTSSINGRQYSSEKIMFGNRRVTSWFASDVGDTKKDIPTTTETTFNTVSDVLKDDWDAREQYIKSKQFRDFMDPHPGGKRNSTKSSESFENFNQKFFDSKKSDSNSVLKPRLSAVQLIEQNYRPTTTPYSRIAIPSENIKSIDLESTLNKFETSHSSHFSKYSSTDELNQAFNGSRLKIPVARFQERLIDADNYKASPIFLNPSIETLTKIDEEATPKIERHKFEKSTGKISHRSIEIDDEPGIILTSDKTISQTFMINGNEMINSNIFPNHSSSSMTSKTSDQISIQSSSIGSTIRIDDNDWKFAPNGSDSNGEIHPSTISYWTTQNPISKLEDSKKGFDVIIRPRESSFGRPQSVTLGLDYPSTLTTTTLRIQSPSNFQNRQTTNHYFN